MNNAEIIDDPIWEYVVATKLQPYLPAVRRWWEGYETMKVMSTGVFPIEYEDIECPPGLSMRMTSTAVRSPIKHVQAFPFVPSAFTLPTCARLSTSNSNKLSVFLIFFISIFLSFLL